MTQTPTKAERETRLNEIREMRRVLKSEERKIETSLFEEESKIIWDSIPEIVAFSWQQYTPYFNDGDTCYFSVYPEPRMIEFVSGARIDPEEVYIQTTRYVRDLGKSIPVPQEEIKKQELGYKIQDESTGEEHTFASLGITYERLQEIKNIIGNFIGNQDEDFLQSLYGDHVSVTMHKTNGASTESYSHD